MNQFPIKMIAIPNKLIDSKVLDPFDKVLFIVILKNNHAPMTYDDFQKASKFSRERISKSIKNLMKHKFIKRSKIDSRSQRFHAKATPIQTPESGELMFSEKIVPLHPDLVPWRSTSNFIEGIFHPLVYSVFHLPQMNEHCNQLYLKKKEQARHALKTGNFDHYVWLHERPYRLQAFTDIHQNLTDPLYWRLLGEIYTDSENIWQNKTTWKELLASKRPDSHHFMNEAEQEAFAKLPDILKIYRGFQHGQNAIGWSYTLTESKAVWFATRFARDTSRALVKSITILKSKALAFKTCRDEDEIVLRKPR